MAFVEFTDEGVYKRYLRDDLRILGLLVGVSDSLFFTMSLLPMNCRDDYAPLIHAMSSNHSISSF